ncbi:MAG: tRNA pseudouridine(38-40) synthase TruA, partial [Proteobacteria bacterium]|nr:tRNA pseudouridine(38-40) synthase TruA [Pseudomonadota bacterium]
IIYNHSTRPSIFRGQVTWHYRPLDHRLMAEAATHLLGEHDFTSFRAMSCQSKTPLRTIHQFTVQRREDLIILDVTANAFLHHMMRNMAGVLMTIGAYQKPVEWVNEVLAAKDRSLGSITAPPYGLYLVKVSYPERFGIVEPILGPLFLNGL